MLNKIERGLLITYFNICGFFNGMKKDERGISGTVVAVLLILVAVLAVGVIWGLLGDAIQEWWDKIINGSNTIT